MMRRGCVIVLLALVLGAGAPVDATISMPTDLADVTALSTTIVRGRVVDVRAFADRGGPVLTAVTLSVGETLKGTAGPTVTFTVHGGVIGRYESRVIGAPVLAVHDDVYVFLRRAADGAVWPVGMSAGVYKVQSGQVVAPVLAGVTAAANGPVVRGDVRRRPMAPAEFSSLVTLAMAGMRTTPDPATRRPGGGARGGGGGR